MRTSENPYTRKSQNSCSLSAEDLAQVREYEKHNKNRESLIGQINRKKRAKNS